MAGQPAGLGSTRWQKFRRQLIATELRGLSCWYCGHPFASRDLIEIEHRISPSLRPDLAWQPWWRGQRFLVPVHGGGRRRCPDPDCNLNCNMIAGGNAAPRDEMGRSAPWSPEFLARKQAERATYRAREGRSSVVRRPRAAAGVRSAPKPAPPAPPPPPPRHVYADVGRVWLAS
jgi:hypothetical protein